MQEVMMEREHWRQVLLRMHSVVTALAKNILTSPEDKERTYQEPNWKFFTLIEMIAEFDPVMKEHIRHCGSGEVPKQFLSLKIKDEMIELVAGEIKSTIVKTIKAAKYFSVILNCTLDASYEKQISLVIRCVDVSKSPVKVKEFFLEFLKVDDTYEFGPFSELKNVLRTLKLDIGDIRGQGYDTGSNVKLTNKGAQNMLLEVNPRAFYTPCGCHSLKLALCDMANSCSKAVTFFGTLQRIFILFSSSTYRWKIFIEHVSGQALPKSLPQTRWESRIESIQAIRFQSTDIREALIHLANSNEDCDIISQAESLTTYGIENFEFLLGMVIWHNLVSATNSVSKFLQKEDMHIDVAINQLQELISFFEKYRENGFEQAMVEAKTIATKMEIEVVFRELGDIRRRRRFDKIASEEPTQSAEESFRVNYFLFIVDQTIALVKRKVEQLHKYEENFGFLFDLEKLNAADDDSLRTCCANLEVFLKHGNLFDIDGNDLFSELKLLREHLPKETKKGIEVLSYLKTMDGTFPNAWIAYRILMTIPVTVASTGRSSSKLKQIQSYLQSIRPQEGPNELATLSIEKDMLEGLDCTSLIDDFAAKITRLAQFK